METFLACILLWPVNFEPRGWAYCAGQILPISQNAALFSLIGTTYGGNGTTNFALPDFRGRVPVGAGPAGPGLSAYALGQLGGSQTTVLTINNLPSHTHTFAVSANNTKAAVSIPAAGNNVLAAPYDTINVSPIAGYNNLTPNTVLNTGNPNTGVAGANLPFSQLQPYLAVNYIIALEGIFPSRS